MNLPTLYEYYTAGGITAGLSADQPYFTLNNKNITLFSGSMHYFRVPQEYWRDRMRKMKAAGLNTVDTYVAWNLHEPEPGVYDFGTGGTDYQELLDIQKFLKIAQEEDLLAIVRPGPYICAEFTFGGMPSWLLREKGIKVRTSDKVFISHVRRFFTTLFALLTTFQFTKGGPIIAFQIENEYAGVTINNNPADKVYLEMLKNMFLDNGIVELLFTSDTPLLGNKGSLPGILYTANFNYNPLRQLRALQAIQPGKALMAMEFWTGWFDHWTEKHNTRGNKEFIKTLEAILSFPASVNMYMFHGGTTWGFLNGGNILGFGTDNRQLQVDTNSYDYDAPLTEAGDYTDKYFGVKTLVEKYNKVQLLLPPQPNLTERIAYNTIEITQYLSLSDIINKAEHSIQSRHLLSMELLPINNNAGQSWGYIVYKKQNLHIPPKSTLMIEGHVCDTVLVLINGVLKNKILERKKDLNGFGYWKLGNSTLNLGEQEYTNATLELVVENWARNNFGAISQYNQFKGLWQGNVTLNGKILYDWEIVPLEFKKNWTNSLTGWRTPVFGAGSGLFKGVLNVLDKKDTYIDMRGWRKGMVIVNGFVLSKHCRLGPQQAAYLPAPFLRDGVNDIIIFEHFVPNKVIKFSKNQIYETLS